MSYTLEDTKNPFETTIQILETSSQLKTNTKS